MVDHVTRLATVLRRAGIDVATGDLIDATRALMLLDLLDRELVRSALRSVMISREPDLAVFDRAFDLVFAPGAALPEQPDAGPAFDRRRRIRRRPPPSPPTSAPRPRAATATRCEPSPPGRWRCTAATTPSDRLVIHRIMRAIDLANMLSAVMRRLRSEGDLSEFELSLRRHEIARALEEFRRALADEIAKSRLAAAGDGDDQALPVGALDRPVLSLSTRRARRAPAHAPAAGPPARRPDRSPPPATFDGPPRSPPHVPPVARRPAASRSTRPCGARHPHRPDVVVLCDISGSVAEFAQFTFTLVHAIHDVLAGVRSFAFVGGVADMTEIFTTANFDVPVQRVLERRGVVGFDGHSDYGAVFQQFCDQFLDDAVGRRTTVLVTGDGRTNFRDAGVAAFARIADRARRVYWLDPEPEAEWETDDSAMAAVPAALRRRVRGVDGPGPVGRDRRHRVGEAARSGLRAARLGRHE